jgi:hypothetical protein
LAIDNGSPKRLPGSSLNACFDLLHGPLHQMSQIEFNRRLFIVQGITSLGTVEQSQVGTSAYSLIKGAGTHVIDDAIFGNRPQPRSKATILSGDRLPAWKTPRHRHEDVLHDISTIIVAQPLSATPIADQWPVKIDKLPPSTSVLRSNPRQQTGRSMLT